MNKYDFLNRFIFLKIKSKAQTRTPVIIGVTRYKYDKSCFVKLFKNSESLSDLDNINNATIKKEYRKPYKVSLRSSFLTLKKIIKFIHRLL